jgi:hypothetical protein
MTDEEFLSHVVDVTPDREMARVTVAVSTMRRLLALRETIYRGNLQEACSAFHLIREIVFGIDRLGNLARRDTTGAAEALAAAIDYGYDETGNFIFDDVLRRLSALGFEIVKIQPA